MMRHELPLGVKEVLATRAHRLHHLLWHAIRNNWHEFDDDERARLKREHPRWVPTHQRFISVEPSAANPEGIEVNFKAGESFLYMHRQMIAGVNAQLIARSEAALVPWNSIPAPDDPDYPVPERARDGEADDIKSDAFYEVLKQRAESVFNVDVLRANDLSTIGAYVESAIHDLLHGRWATESRGVMADFPALEAREVTPIIDSKFDATSVDWLGHPWSSHVNSVFWKLHGWCDQVADAWLRARGLEAITWTDTWQGDIPEDAEVQPARVMPPAERLRRLHDQFHHGHQSEHELMRIVETISRFRHCHIGFDYTTVKRVPIRALRADPT